MRRANESDYLQKVIVKSNKEELMKQPRTSSRGKLSSGLKREGVGADTGTQ